MPALCYATKLLRKAWAKAVFSGFAPKFVGKELAVACINFSEVESAVDIENTLNEGRTCGFCLSLLYTSGNEQIRELS